MRPRLALPALPASWRWVRSGQITRPVHIAASPYKTGTTSLGRALISLGVGHTEMPYRGALLTTYRRQIRAMNQAATQAPSWDAFRRECGDEATRSLIGLTRSLAPYDVFPDAPFGHTHLHPFLRKMLAPRAKFIWIHREIEDWIESVRRWEQGHPDLYVKRSADWSRNPRARRRALRRTWETRLSRFHRLADAFPEDCLELRLEELTTMDALAAFYGIDAAGKAFPKRNVGRGQRPAGGAEETAEE